MHIAVQDFTGKTFIVDNVTGSDTIRTVKEKIEKQNGTPIDQVRLVWGGKLLMDDRTLADYNILPNTQSMQSSMLLDLSGRRPPTPPKLHMVLRLHSESPTRETSSGAEPTAKPSSS